MAGDREISTNAGVPKCISINICDYVIEDVRTHNKSLIGLFNQISAAAFPVRHPRLILFVSLVDGRGTSPIVVEIGPEEGEPVFTAKGEVKWVDPLSVFDLVMDINGLVLPKPGPYYARVRTETSQVLGERRFLVNKIDLPKARR